tara:strand:- start:127 stop:312 length:186 start_codon:yes stop_codon:yes gene_type:complete
MSKGLKAWAKESEAMTCSDAQHRGDRIANIAIASNRGLPMLRGDTTSHRAPNALGPGPVLA